MNCQCYYYYNIIKACTARDGCRACTVDCQYDKSRGGTLDPGLPGRPFLRRLIYSGKYDILLLLRNK